MINKDEVYEVLAKRQDLHVDGLKNPHDWDPLSKWFNQVVEEAETLDDISTDIQYALSILKKVNVDFLQYLEQLETKECHE